MKQQSSCSSPIRKHIQYSGPHHRTIHNTFTPVYTTNQSTHGRCIEPIILYRAVRHLGDDVGDILGAGNERLASALVVHLVVGLLQR